ncbi:MAG TPA: RsmE family RNA methyltransferase [Thermoanaerobaculia bacterium]|nr:RsmE family RNA methyltransferase [Thermoanaerobaculia bacterium]
MNHRFFVPDGVEVGAAVALPEEELHHARVLRVREGEDVEVFDARGKNFRARFRDRGVEIVEETANREPATSITLAMSIVQLEKFEFVLQKATELGVASFVPLITDRMELRIERVRGKDERWRKIVLEAVKQSGRSKIPPIGRAMTFDEAILCDGPKIVFDAGIEPLTTDKRQPTTLFIGPEGGFSERELALAKEHGAAFERLGPRRLRAETAAIAAVTIVSARSGDI